MANPTPMKAPFPTPPPFYHYFTKSDLSRLRQLRKEASQSSNDTQADFDILQLPPELRYLIPPPPPADKTPYTTFGTTIDPAALDLSLTSAGVEQLYPDHPSVRTDPRPHLIALARSLLTTFLSLVGVLAANPTLYEERTQDLEVLAFNISDLVNLYRPHQARESLILGLEGRVEALREEMKRINDGKRRVEDLLGGLEKGQGGVEEDVREVKDENMEVDDEGGKQNRTAEGKWRERQKALWQAMEEEMNEVEKDVEMQQEPQAEVT